VAPLEFPEHAIPAALYRAPALARLERKADLLLRAVKDSLPNASGKFAPGRFERDLVVIRERFEQAPVVGRDATPAPGRDRSS
jgi:hypothetical protein